MTSTDILRAREDQIYSEFQAAQTAAYRLYQDTHHVSVDHLREEWESAACELVAHTERRQQNEP